MNASGLTQQEALFEYCLRLGDTSLILGQRISEWCGHAPILEEDIAMSNIALDLIGQARIILTYAGEVEGKGRTEDDLAYLRDARQYRNLLMDLVFIHKSSHGELCDLPFHGFLFLVNQVVGFVSWNGSYITWLYVAPPHQRRGIGRRLLKEAMERIGPEAWTSLLAGNEPAIFQ